MYNISSTQSPVLFSELCNTTNWPTVLHQFADELDSAPDRWASLVSDAMRDLAQGTMTSPAKPTVLPIEPACNDLPGALEYFRCLWGWDFVNLLTSRRVCPADTMQQVKEDWREGLLPNKSIQSVAEQVNQDCPLAFVLKNHQTSLVSAEDVLQNVDSVLEQWQSLNEDYLTQRELSAVICKTVDGLLRNSATLKSQLRKNMDDLQIMLATANELTTMAKGLPRTIEDSVKAIVKVLREHVPVKQEIQDRLAKIAEAETATYLVHVECSNSNRNITSKDQL